MNSENEDEGGPEVSISDAVQQVTVRALQELQLDPMPSAASEQDSRPNSATADNTTVINNNDTGRLLRDIGQGLGYGPGESVDEGSEYNMSSARSGGESRSSSSDDRGDRGGGMLQAELVVLDPDHPLMKRFQNALKTHLTNQIERTRLAHREMRAAVKRKGKEREDLGVELYSLQQELAKQQSKLEDMHDKRNLVGEKRARKEVELNKTRSEYKNKKDNINNETKRNAQLQTEVDNLMTRLFHMNNAKSDVRSDVAVMKRAAQRADVDVAHLETFKKRQDLYVDRLQSEVNRLREEIALSEAQQAAQAQESLRAKSTLEGAVEEVEGVKEEKKMLYAQWKSALVGVQRRDEAHTAMQEALKLARKHVISLETEVNGYKKSTQKEEERNETLTMMMKKAEHERDLMRQAIRCCVELKESLNIEYNTYARTLNQTEQQFNQAAAEKQNKVNEVSTLRKQIEREYEAKIKLEDEVMKEMQLRLTAIKSQRYTIRSTQQLRERKKKLEHEVAEGENSSVRDELKITEGRSRVGDLKKVMDELVKEAVMRNHLLNKNQADAAHNHVMIERKQQEVDALGRKIHAKIQATTGEEISPQELEIRELNKRISQTDESSITQQQHWLRQQYDFVKLCKIRDERTSSVDLMNRSQQILVHKKLRIENELDFEKKELSGLSKKKSDLIRALSRINNKLMLRNQTSEDMKQANIITEKEYIAQLKEAELESIKSQAKLQYLVDEKEKLLKQLIDAERGIMLWEKKLQLARETKSAINTGVGEEEMRAMQAEIHRMQVRYSQLMRQQEEMIREMEQSVTRRHFISYQADIVNSRQQNGKKSNLTVGGFQKKLSEIRKKIKNTQREVGSCDEDISQLRVNQEQVGSSLEEKQKLVQHLQEQLDSLSGKIEELFDTKQRNLNDIIAKQTKVKYLAALKEDKYTTFCKSEDSLKAEVNKQEDRFHHTINILDRIGQEFPHARHDIARLSSRFTYVTTA